MKRYFCILILLCNLAFWACSGGEDEASPSLEGVVVIAQPRNQTVIEGQTATFRVSVSSATPLTYQWLRDGIDIPGATGSRYDTPQANLAVNGSYYSVRISDASSSMLTSSARLDVLAETAIPEPSERAIDPTATDPAIASDFGLHYATINPAVSPRDKLFLFFPGTGAQPKGYRLILRAAANNGYHAIGMAYPNTRTVGYLCSGADNECPGNLHEETLTGENVSTQVEVSAADSIINRLTRLLVYLDDQHPGEGWDLFLTDQGAIAWNDIRVAGHSQGGATAGYIGQRFTVDRAVFFSAPYDLVNGEIAAWVSSTGATGAQFFFGFSHLQDGVVSWPSALQNWSTLGLDRFGDAVDVDTGHPPYDNSHMLSTNLPAVTNLLPFHNITVVDVSTPLDAGGLPTYRHVWQYLCFII